MSGPRFVSPCSDADIADAARSLREGALVAFPTETVYGLGADATRADAVARVFAVKGRPADHPLIVHVGHAEAIRRWARAVPDYAWALAARCWPGPLTLLLPRSPLAADFVVGGQDCVGLRVPDQPLALRLLAAFHAAGGEGIAAPSANRFGQVSPTSAQAVMEELGERLTARDRVLDGGACAVGVESTIVDCTGERPRILRPGAITRETVEQVTGLPMDIGENPGVRVPGSLAQHYAPAARVLLDVEPAPGDGFIALAAVPTPPGVTRLAAPASDDMFAQVLYAALREGDAQGLRRIVVRQPAGGGIAIAIRDRLARAAASGSARLQE